MVARTGWIRAGFGLPFFCCWLLAGQKPEEPAAAVAAFEKGVAYASRGDYEHAEPPFHRACLLDANLPGACVYFGRTLYLLDRFGEALDVLRRASEHDAGNAEIRRIEALSLEGLGRMDEAEAAFREAIRLDHGRSPANDNPAIDYGVLLYRRGMAEAAVGLLQGALKRHPDGSRAHLELGCVLLELGRATEAAFHLERAAALDPKSGRAHLLLGKAYLRLGKNNEAQDHLAQGSRMVK